jgi:hypothetical protein
MLVLILGKQKATSNIELRKLSPAAAGRLSRRPIQNGWIVRNGDG